MTRLGTSVLTVLLAAALAAAGCGGDGDGKDSGSNLEPKNKQDGPTREVAGVGSGKAGRSLDDMEGMMVTSVKQYFAAKERVVFEIQLPKTLQLYEATTGHMPQTHEEFETEILQKGMIKLPTLPPGRKYVWDPKLAKLMVEKTAPASDGEPPAKQN